jgi:hypothetical protein
MEALVTIGGYELPEPSSYNAVTSTIVDSGRNVEGKVVGSVVRSDVAKIELTWKFLTVEQWATMLSIFNSSFFNEVRFFNQATGNYDVRTMYVSDRDASVFRRDPNSGTVMGWVNPKLSLVEV